MKAVAVRVVELADILARQPAWVRHKFAGCVKSFSQVADLQLLSFYLKVVEKLMKVRSGDERSVFSILRQMYHVLGGHGEKLAESGIAKTLQSIWVLSDSLPLGKWRAQAVRSTVAFVSKSEKHQNAVVNCCFGCSPSSICLEGLFALPPHEFVNFRGKIWESYTKLVIEGKHDAVTFTKLSGAYSAAFKVITHDEFKEIIPGLTRQMKRRPEVAIELAYMMCKSMTIELSGYLKDILDPAGLAELKNNDAGRRSKASALFNAMTAHSSDFAPVSELINKIAGDLKSSQAAQARQGTLAGIEALSFARATKDERQATFGPLIASGSGLLNVVSKDANEQSKIAALKLVGRLLKLCSGKNGDAVAKECLALINGIKATDAVRLAAVNCLAEGSGATAEPGRVKGPEEIGWFDAVAKDLPKILPTPATKAGYRPSSITAWRVFVALTQGKSELDKNFVDHYKFLLDKDTYLTSEKLIMNSSPSEIETYSALISALLRRSKDLTSFPLPDASPEEVQFPPKAPGKKAFARMVAYVLTAESECHHSESSSKDEGECKQEQPTLINLKKCLECMEQTSAENFANALVVSFYEWLGQLEQSSPNMDHDLPAGITPCSLRKTFFKICSIAEYFSSASTTIIVLCAHHRLLTSRAWTNLKIWQHLVWGFDRTGNAFCDISSKILKPGHLDCAKEVLKQSLTLPEPDVSGFRRAALGMYATFSDEKYMERLIQEQGEPYIEGLYNDLLDEVLANLQDERVAAETKNNVEVFLTPKGQLWIPEGGYEAIKKVAADAKAVSKSNKHLAGIGLDDDDNFGKAKPKKTAAKGKKGVTGKQKDDSQKTKADMEQEQIAEQAVLRAEMKVWCDQASFALDALHRLSNIGARPEWFQQHMVALMPRIMVLLASPLTSSKTRAALRSIVPQVVPANAVSLRSFLPDVLLAVAHDCATDGLEDEDSITTKLLTQVSAEEPLSEPAFVTLMPVITYVLLHSSIKLKDAIQVVLQLLQRQLRLEAEGDGLAILDGLHAAMKAVPPLVPEGRVVLELCCSYLATEKEHVQKLCAIFVTDDVAARRAVVSGLRRVDEDLWGRAEPYLYLGSLDEGNAEFQKECASFLEEAEITPSPKFFPTLLELLTCHSGAIRALAGIAVVDLLTQLADTLAEKHDAMIGSVLTQVVTIYSETDCMFNKLSCAKCFVKFAKLTKTEEQITLLFHFLLQNALAKPLFLDADAEPLRDELFSAGQKCIETFGKEHTALFFTFVDECAAKSGGNETLSLASSVFNAAIAKHLAAGDEKIKQISDRMIEKLTSKTTRSVQNTIAKALPPLIKANAGDGPDLVDKLIQKAFTEKDEVQRRGAAMGVGATIKGLSVSSLKNLNIMQRLQEAAVDKKSANMRQGALMCFEGLSMSLGRLFEPYVITTLPVLLGALADTNTLVRTAAHNSSKAVMGQLSGHGVKLVLPSLLEGISDKQWRTKVGSIELLGTMSHCAPKQLTACLPQIVPAIVDVLADTNSKVAVAAQEALKTISSVIQNPEIKALGPQFIAALTDPSNETLVKTVLDALLGTSFVHSMDAPSLALICPVVARAMKERGAEMKKRGAQIVGSMVLLVKDAKDIMPYLDTLLPLLQQTLTDPIPDVRATAAKALGTMVRNLPESAFQDEEDTQGGLLPWLFSTLQSHESAVERSGAAHGLSEVLMAMGTERIAGLLPDILQNASDTDASVEVREGYLGLFVFLPNTMKDAFAPYVAQVLEVLLPGLADEAEPVRDVAYRASQVLVTQFGTSQTSLLLPPLEEGFFHGDWRIRQCSIQLLGGVIENLLKEHRQFGADLMSCEVLTKERRAFMLSSLYMVRSDENHTVAQTAAVTWKTLVSNTPKTLRELLPILMKRIVSNLSSKSEEKKLIAGRCMGDLVSKLGEKLMAELMPILMSSLKSENSHMRHGVCSGMAELLQAAPKQVIADHTASIVPAVQKAIVDSDEAVRKESARCVRLLYNAVGDRAVTEIVPWVLKKIRGSDPEDGQLEHLLDGLRQLLIMQSAHVLPLVIGKLNVAPYSTTGIMGLSTIAAVTEANALHRNLSEVIPTCVSAVIQANEQDDEALKEAAHACAKKVQLAVKNVGGVHLLLAELLSDFKDEDASRRAIAAEFAAVFFEETTIPIVSSLEIILPVLLPLALADEDDNTLKCGMKALKALCVKSNCTKEDLASNLKLVRESLVKVDTNEDGYIRGLALAGGLEPLYPIFQQGLMFGTADQREIAARGLGDLVKHTPPTLLKPFVVKLTGPLIRIVGDRFPVAVKVAILDALQMLLQRGGVSLKPFLPQLQTTYVKCLSDATSPESSEVRSAARHSLKILTGLSPRTDSLLSEFEKTYKFEI